MQKKNSIIQLEYRDRPVSERVKINTKVIWFVIIRVFIVVKMFYYIYKFLKILIFCFFLFIKLFHLGGFIAAVMTPRSLQGYSYTPDEFHSVKVAYLVVAMISLVWSLLLIISFFFNIVNIDPFLRLPWFPLVSILLFFFLLTLNLNF